MRPQPDSICVNSNIYSGILSLLKLRGTADLGIRCDIFYINIICPYDICEFILFLIC